MPRVISEIELTSGQRAHLMGGDAKRDPYGSQPLRMRLVFVSWAGDVPYIEAEFGHRKDEHSAMIWQPADKLPLPLIFASLRDIVNGSASFAPRLDTSRLDIPGETL